MVSRPTLASAVVSMTMRLSGMSAALASSSADLGPSASNEKMSTWSPANRALDAMKPNAIDESSSALSIGLSLVDAVSRASMLSSFLSIFCDLAQAYTAVAAVQHRARIALSLFWPLAGTYWCCGERPLQAAFIHAQSHARRRARAHVPQRLQSLHEYRQVARHIARLAAAARQMIAALRLAFALDHAWRACRLMPHSSAIAGIGWSVASSRRRTDAKRAHACALENCRGSSVTVSRN